MTSNNKLVFGALVVVVSLLGFGLWQWLQSASPTAEERSSRLEKLIAAGEFNEALQFTNQWLASEPGNPEAMWRQGQALEGLGRQAEALQAYEDISSQAKGNAVARAKLRAAELYFQRGNASEVERLLRLSLAADGELVEANYQLYLILTLQARRWEGEPYLIKLAELGEAELEDIVLLSLMSMYISDKEGRDLFPQEIPGNERFRLIDARLAFDRNSLTEAETILRGLIQKNPQLPDAWAWLGWTLLQQRQAEGLAKWRAEIPKQAAEHPLAWLTLGMWYLQSEQYEIAARCFAEVLLRDSINSTATYQLAILLNRFGDTENAEKLSQRSLALHDLEQLTYKLYTRKDQPDLYKALKDRIDTIPNSMESIGRLIEAAAWQSWISRQLPSDTQAAAEMTRLKGLAAKVSQRTVAEKHPLFGIDFQKWSLPAQSDLATPPTTANVDKPNLATTTGTKWRNVAQQIGVDFIFANDRDPALAGLPINKATGGGVGVLDYDRDGRPDLYWTQGGKVANGQEVMVKQDALYRNLLGEKYVDISQAAMLQDDQFGAGLAVGDFDCDGFADLYIANQEFNQLWRNNGDGTFSNVTSQAGMELPIWTTSSLMVDLNGDLLPDLFDATYVEGNDYKTKLCVTDGPPRGCGPTAFTPSQDRIWINQGDGRFLEQGKELGIHAAGGYGLGVVAADFRHQAGMDIFVANDESANFYFRNRVRGQSPNTYRKGGFNERAVLEGVAFDRDGVAQACMGVAIDDADGDGLLDLFITNFYNQANILYLQRASGFIDATTQSGMRTPSYRMLGFGAQFIDADLDGQPDLFVTNGHVDDYSYKNVPFKMPAQFFRNQGKGRFVEEKAISLGEFFNERYLGRGMATCDWNGDGREDVLISHVDAPGALLQNETVDAGNYVAFELVGVKSPRDAYGTVIEVVANGKKRTRQLVAGGGYQAANEQRLIMGIGDARVIDSVTIRWISGAVQEEKNLPINSRWIAIEGEKLIRDK